jgi:hypothetical protein
VSILRRPVVRFVIWALVLVGVAAGAAVAGWSAWVILGVVLGTWVIIVLVERAISSPRRRSDTPRARVAPSAPAHEPDVSAVVRVTPVASAEPPEPEPEPAAAAAAAPAAPPPPPQPQRRRVVPRRSAPAPAPAQETQWNIWTLEEVVRDNAPENEELVYLTVSLREFADANGLLPAGFDPLVRESFGSLLPVG